MTVPDLFVSASVGDVYAILPLCKNRTMKKIVFNSFFYGLDERQFQMVRSSLTDRVPLIGLKEAYSIVRQEEDLQLNNRSREDKHEFAAFVARPSLDSE